MSASHCLPAPSRPALHTLLLCCLMVLLMVAGCSQSRRERGLDEYMRAYGSDIRWGNIESAIGYIDPEVLKNRPISSTDLERYKQVQIAGYRESALVVEDDGTATQVVEIEFINVHTQSISSMIDRQRWRYDNEAKRWWLVSGLPDLTAGRR